MVLCFNFKLDSMIRSMSVLARIVRAPPFSPHPPSLSGGGGGGFEFFQIGGIVGRVRKFMREKGEGLSRNGGIAILY